MYMTLISIKWLKHPIRPPQATFKVAPSMNKFEIRDYLKNIYGLPVKKVMTENFMGERKRIFGKRKIFYYKQPDFKRAHVTFEKNKPVYTPRKGPGR
eukprot:CAMPEP_0198644022 /NCGR_PEP_ID=MMETSP1467-20131203/348_1 /TAXON_ID=1462469 /ORGANISM="unid. sp., Strain CCMP2135" /LENGTH=96 /DNA_ID=CAMNT_0044379463 /DNA_START=99 /DNA_END=389 /DNA_ORIENTATION=+